jgi:hypothetical protein
MPTNLLLLPLLGGYWFIHTFYYTRIRSLSLDGYRLLLESAFAGMVFTACAHAIVLYLQRFSPAALDAWTAWAAPIPYLGTTTLAAVLGLLAAYPLNGMIDILPFVSRRKIQRWAITHHGNEMQRMLQQASASEKPISFTLDSRKTYIGLVVSAPSLAPSATHFAILPFLSGYREPETLNLIFTVDYLNTYEEKKLDPTEFRVVVPIQKVQTIAFFDPSVYHSFVVQEETTGPAGT